MKDFKDQIAFITGGASGAGFGQAQVFGRAGAKIVIADVRPAAVDKALTALKREGITAHGIVLDITDRDAYARAADEVEAVFGAPPTLLFNTAGVNSFGPAENSTYDDFDWIVGVNLGGVINGMVTFVPRMIKAGKPAHIVSVSSLGGLQGGAIVAPYSAAKAAVINLMESYHQSLARYGIGVSVLCPANIKSNIAEATRIRPQKFSAHAAMSKPRKRSPRCTASTSTAWSRSSSPGTSSARSRTGQLYVIPYPEAKEMLRKHFDDIVAAVLPMEADPEGARKRTEALQNWAADRARVFAKTGQDA